ncbi:Rdx family protein [Demequina zhanjiangensis]|uniref:Rdx family protein n=1 Tax=Demequina zhanjiangensis TaxID=3051659 RepID=A0ABT8G278_9MICO|nr:Rdx family protein [Demequina sp. SYSU T00b26]MDN4473172.1 Rdx family protein [Demequina sp. SYSU T00b26]
MQITIEYCVPCGYLPRATEAQTRLLEEFGNALEGVTLKTGRKGVFSFTADGEEIYAKPAEFDIDAIVADVREKIGPVEGVQPEGRDLLMGKKH